MATVSVVKSDRYQFQAVFDTVFAVVITAEDVASLADAAGSSESFTIPGVVLGDMVIGRSFSVSTAGITVTADVTAANTVIVRVQNESGGVVDLASATLKLLIGRPAAALFA